MILDEFVVVKSNSLNKAPFEALGYKAVNSYFTVKPEHLSEKSSFKVRFKCDACGYEYTSMWSSYAKKKNKDWCIKCYPSATKDIKFITTEFDKKGYDLITDYYINAHQHLEYRCRKHPETIQKIIYNSLQRGCGCWHCGAESRAETNRMKPEQIKQVAESRGFILISCEGYINEKSTVSVKCAKHPDIVQFVDYNKLQQKFNCPYCKDEQRKTELLADENSGTEFRYVSQYVRSYIDEWKYNVGAKANGICEVSGLKANGDFVVHHLLSSNSILQEIYYDVDLPLNIKKTRKVPYKILTQIVDKYVEAHKNVSGAFLHPDIHKLFHKTYGIYKNTPQQFYEFKERWQSGEFN